MTKSDGSMQSRMYPFHTWRCLRVPLSGLILLFPGVHRVLGGEAFLFLRGLGVLGGEALKELHNSV